MSKDTFYFSHDYNARNDPKIKALIRKHGLCGYGLFWAVVEDLYNNANALPTDYESIAFDLRTNPDVIESLINDFELFVIEGDIFGSLSIQKRIDERNAKSTKARDNANKRWNKDANAMPPHSKRNAIKESKVKENKESKVKEIKEKKEFVPSGTFQTFIEDYSLFFEKKTGIRPKIGSSDGKAANELIEYLTSVSTEKNETGAIESFRFIVKEWGKLDNFYGSQIKLIQISSNINNIINQIKNGKSKSTVSQNQQLRDKIRDELADKIRNGSGETTNT